MEPTSYNISEDEGSCVDQVVNAYRQGYILSKKTLVGLQPFLPLSKQDWTNADACIRLTTVNQLVVRCTKSFGKRI